MCIRDRDNTLQLKLALMEGPDFPIALGVIRDVEAPTYGDAVHEQIEEEMCIRDRQGAVARSLHSVPICPCPRC